MVFNWNIEFVDIAANAQDLTGGYYHEILMRLRHRLADDCIRCRTGRSRPILPEFNRNNTSIRWFQINLHVNRTTRVTLLLRRDDLYVVGYRVNEQQWREFGVEGNRHLINGSELVGFSENYTDLARLAGHWTVGRDALLTAAVDLASTTDRKKVARSLLVVITMFSEAGRFLPIQQFVSDNWENGSTVPSWIGVDLVHRWGTLCGYVLYYYNHPNEEWVPQSLLLWDQTVVVRTIDDMLEYLAILMKNPDKIQPAPKS